MKLKKLLAAVAVLGAFACTSAFAATISLTADSTTVAAGDTVVATFNYNDNTEGLSWGVFKLAATNGMTITQAKNGSVFTDADHSVNELCWTPADPFYDSGAVATITVKIPDDATAGSTFTLTATCDPNNTANGDMDDLDLGTASITFTIPADDKDPYTLTDAAPGNKVGEQDTYYTTVTVNEAMAGARFQVVNGETTKSWELPAICGSGKFVAIVATNGATGTFANSIVVDGVAVSNVVNY